MLSALLFSATRGEESDSVCESTLELCVATLSLSLLAGCVPIVAVRSIDLLSTILNGTTLMEQSTLLIQQQRG